MPSPLAAILALCLFAGACSPQAKPGSPGGSSGSPELSQTVGAEAGLEIITFVSAAPERTLAAVLAPYADQPLPISHELQDVWDAHGLRMVSLPIDDAPAILAQLQTGGGSQRQWLGQAYSWTEAARGAPMGAGSVVALDAERIRLPAGALRLLVRSWLEPAPPAAQVGAVSVGGEGSGSMAGALPGAILRVELVAQAQEAHPDDSSADPLAINEPRIEAESQGMIFSRLYARMSVPAGRALLILAERPSVDWKRVAARPDPNDAAPATPRGTARATDSESSRPKKSDESGATPKPEPLGATKPGESRPPAGAGPRLGQVVRAPITGTDSSAPRPDNGRSSSQEYGTGPAASRVPTLGEAMLSRSAPAIESRTPAPPRRTLVLLLPRVPREYHLLGPSGAPTPARREAPPSRE